MKIRILLLAVSIALIACGRIPATGESEPGRPIVVPQNEIATVEVRRLLESAERQTRITTGYTQQYFVIAYPNGDVPADTGACTDVVIRAFRAAGIDLQKAVHEDMVANFSKYPGRWGLKRPDTNIDHRRVPNLQTYFTRLGKSLGATRDPASFLPGDVVTWDLDGKGMTHIGLISNVRDERTGRPYVYHNIGDGARLEDRLFEWKITGRYRIF